MWTQAHREAHWQARGDFPSSLKAIWRGLHVVLREREGREASPSAAIIDSQTSRRPQRGRTAQAATPDQADAVGCDAGKKVKGRKIHALVDTLGLPTRLVVHAAGAQDHDGAALLLDKVRRSVP